MLDIAKQNSVLQLNFTLYIYIPIDKIDLIDIKTQLGSFIIFRPFTYIQYLF